MIVFHGTDSISADSILSNGIDFLKCSPSTDNSIGFYTTPNFEFAVARAIQNVKKQRINIGSVQPIVLKMDFDETKIDSDFKVKKFDLSEEWKYFVVINRIGQDVLNRYGALFDGYDHNLDMKYDIVYDPTADAGIAVAVNDIKFGKAGNIKDLLRKIESVNVGSTKIWDRQISFHSEKSLSLLSGFEIKSIT